MKAFADYNDYKIVGTYEDAGKSGKSIVGKLPMDAERVHGIRNEYHLAKLLEQYFI